MAEKEYIDKVAFNYAIREAVKKYPNSFYNGLEVARQIAHDLPAADVRPVAWIPVTERLPENDGFTLIFTANGHAGVCYFTNGWWGGYDKGGITHWMPLPEPPKGE